MQLPHPFTHTPMPRYPVGAPTEEVYQEFKRLDGEIRTHNLARHVAAISTRDDRAAFLDGMARRRAPAFMNRFKRLLAWYWRRQRRHRAETDNTPR